MTKNWERYRVHIINLYKQQNLPLHEVRRILQDQYGFTASIRAYRTRFDKWRVSKYNCQRRRNSNMTQWTSDSSELSPSPRTIPAVAMLTGTSGPLPVPVSVPLPRSGEAGGNTSSHGSPYAPGLSPTASLPSYPGSPHTPADGSVSYHDDGKLTSFAPPLSSLDIALPRHQHHLSHIHPQIHPQSQGGYAPASTENASPQSSTSTSYPYYGPPISSSGYFDVHLPRYQGILSASHDSVKHEY